MITTEDKFKRLLSARKDFHVISKLKTERDERSSLLDKFAGTEGFEEQIAMLEDEISQIDAALVEAKKDEGQQTKLTMRALRLTLS